MPVYSSHLNPFDGAQIAERIREARRGSGRTLRAVAARLHMSPAQLSKIETGKSPLDLSQLASMATELGLPLSALLPERREYHYLVTRRQQIADAPPRRRELLGHRAGPVRHHNAVWPLADAFVGKHIEPVIADIYPLTDRDLQFIAHDHEEFMFVLSGDVESLIETSEGLITERLRPGDCVYFASYLPHCHRSASQTPARGLNLMYSLHGVIDVDDGATGGGHRFYRRNVHRDVVKEASEKLALLRRSRGLALAELARDLQIPVRQLRDIELGRRALTLPLLFQVARRFKRPIEYFFAATAEGQPSHFVQRREGVRSLPGRRRRRKDAEAADAYVYTPLAVGFPNRGMHPYYIQVAPGSAGAAETHEHHGQEFVYVLDGEIEFVTSADGLQQVLVLGTGDSLYLESGVPHMLRGRSHNPFANTCAEVIDVFWSPLGEDYLFEENRDT